MSKSQNHKWGAADLGLRFGVWAFGILLSFVISHSSFLQFHFNIIPLHDYFVTLHAFEGRWGQDVTCFEVKFRFMPWANDLATVNLSF